MKATPLPDALLLEWVAEPTNEGLWMLTEVSRAVNSSLILEDIFEALGDVLHTHIPFRQAVIVILDDTQNGIKVLVRIDEHGGLDISGENNLFAGYDPVVDRVLKNPVPHLYGKTDLPKSVVFEADGTADPKTASASGLVVPLINKGIVIGLIAMLTDRESGFTYHQQDLLSQVSAQLAIAVENAKFYWQTQAQASREFLINQLTTAIRQSLDIETMLSTAVKELGRVLGVSRCFIRYFDKTSNETQTFSYLAPGTPALENIDTRFEQQVFSLRQNQPWNPFVLNDVRDCPENLPGAETFEQAQIKSLAVFPVLVRDALAGTMTLHQCDAHRTWVVEDIEMMRAMAEHLGVALHQAQLFSELAAQKQALEQTLDELQQTQLHLIQSEKMAVLGQFVAGIAHEVNTPLGTIIGNNTTLKACFEKLLKSPGDASLTQTVTELLDINKLATSRIQDIVKNLRNFARLDESEMKTIDLREGIDSTLQIIQNSIPKHITVTKNYGSDVPNISCYPGLLNQVFMNMLVNALHALDTAKQGKITIETRYVKDEKRVEVCISDTGKGIKPEHLARIFDPGFTTKGSGVGTGLGLALCYRIIEKHKGIIRVDSTLDKGTTFTVELPA